MINDLNSNFALENELKFITGPGELVFVEIENQLASARIALHGAHVTHYQPKGEKPLIWVGDDCIYKEGTAIRGGIPVCWPWFGAHPSDKSLPSHGFVRNRNWNVKETKSTENGTEITFFVDSDEKTLQLWPNKFTVELKVTVGKKLHVELTSFNNDKHDITFGGALHTYFPVSEICGINISGLESTDYVDALQNNTVINQQGAITFAEEVDRVYINTAATCIINDPGSKHQIVVEKSGSQSTVVWNPWTEKSKGLSGFANEDYHSMVCIETTNALKDVYVVAPGKSHIMTQTISSKSLNG